MSSALRPSVTVATTSNSVSSVAEMDFRIPASSSAGEPSSGDPRWAMGAPLSAGEHTSERVEQAMNLLPHLVALTDRAFADSSSRSSAAFFAFSRMCE